VIEISFAAASTEHESPVRFQVERPDLMGASHCKNKSVSVYGDDVPGRGEFLIYGMLVAFAITSFFSCSNNCQHLFGPQIDFSNRMVLGVTQVEEIFLVSKHVANSLRLMELRIFVTTVYKSNFAVTNRMDTFEGLFIN
jgi:hypothetical protein